jgi:NAD(P)-dependent dehydrogenase (short-subunit alcohol dehydrogenase family)
MLRAASRPAGGLRAGDAKGRTMHRAIVTGGTRGIGLAVAKALAAGGGHVMVTGRDEGHVDTAVQEIAAVPGSDPSRVAGAAVDVRDAAGVAALVADTAARFGGLDVLVNNAGVGAFAEVAAMSDEDWARVIDTNLTGVFYCTRAAIPVLKQAGGGWVINIASLSARNPFPGGAAYCSSKAALVAFTEALMQEVRFDGIRATVVLPGSVATEFSGGSAAADWKLSPDDVAEVVVDLLRHPARSLPSRVEIRPSQPRKR